MPYVPNAEQVTEPTSSQEVASAALEFRTLKEYLEDNIPAANASIADHETRLDVIEGYSLQTRTVRAPSGESLTQLPAAASRANRLLSFSPLGDAGLTPFTETQVAAAIAAAYAAGTTAAAVGYAAPGGESSTVQRKLEESASVFDFMTAAQIADVKALTRSIDMAASIQAAINALYAAGGGDLWFPAGRYRIDSTITMRRGVNLIGPQHKLSAGQLYRATSEATAFSGIAAICPSSTLTTRAIYYDYKIYPREARPYNAVIENIWFDGTNAGGTCNGLEVINPPAGEGVYNTGSGVWATRLINAYFTHFPGHGAYVLSDATGRTSAQFDECRFAFNKGHGLLFERCFDVMVRECFSFANVGDGICLRACGIERVFGCDIFNNGGHGITADSFSGRYTNNHVEQNGKHGYNIVVEQSTVARKQMRIVDGRVGGNSASANGVYSDVYLGVDSNGVAAGQVSFIGGEFGGGANTANGFRQKAVFFREPSSSYSSIPCSMTGSAVSNLGVTVGNEIFQGNFWETTNFSNVLSSDGYELQARWLTMPASSGSYTLLAWILSGGYVKTANTSAAMITGIAGGLAQYKIGQELYIMIGDANTGVDFTGTTLKGNGGVDLAAGAGTVGKVIHCINVDGTNWACHILG